MFAYCLNSPVNSFDPQGTSTISVTDGDRNPLFIGHYGLGGGGGGGGLGGGGPRQPTHVLEKSVADAVKYVTNTDEQTVLDADDIAFYNGVPVAKLPIGTGAFSFGIIFLGDNVGARSDSIATVQHEYGHAKHYQMIGPLSYASTVFVPSVAGYHLGGKEYKNNYYSYVYEYTANVLGKANYDVAYLPATEKLWWIYLLYTMFLPG